ncbi:hypothetical protein PR003_g24512 [Phytophthora rubi]|nr:hypothetical protein PF003_g26640 [Phytophthora fragariae]KAE9112509.1 hypothetical protein PF006_g19963 [Phytophthora fragariae]KAE9293419.1 hypothetical protein PR003_g24512 [Phytophthora rubi]KAE9295854.1 hypothetical protein PF001_g17137 [Phytophthora fragariae]
MDPEKKELNAEMDASRDRFRVGARFKGPVGTYMGSRRYFKFVNISFGGWMNAANPCSQLH